MPLPSDGKESKERTVRVTGDKKQIEMAREMIKEVMSQVCPDVLPYSFKWACVCFN